LFDPAFNLKKTETHTTHRVTVNGKLGRRERKRTGLADISFLHFLTAPPEGGLAKPSSRGDDQFLPSSLHFLLSLPL
jgi:hypothetical protein